MEASSPSEKIFSNVCPRLCKYHNNGLRWNKQYWWCDQIYPKWPVFIESILDAVSQKHKYFTTMQASARKDVKRTCGALQIMWHVINIPSRLWSLDAMRRIMKCMIILHNMTVEERIY